MLEAILPFLIAGFVFGFSGGIAPGPTMTLVITQAMQYTWKEGAKVAVAPLCTDAPIILAGLLLFSLFQEFNAFLGAVSLLGAGFLVYLGYESFTAQPLQSDIKAGKPKSLLKGILVNALNPAPYMFWFGIGCPMILKAYQVSLGAVSAFLASFFIGLVGTKVMVALLVIPARRFLRTQGYVWVMRICGLLLLVYAALFFRDSLKAFGLL